MENRVLAEQLFKKTLSLAAEESDGRGPLGGISIQPLEKEGSELEKELCSFFSFCITNAANKKNKPLPEILMEEAAEAREIFISYYEKRPDQVKEALGPLESGDKETLAERIACLWLPELNISEESILKKWRLKDVKENPDPVRPEEVTIQLNALYTAPEGVPSDLGPELQKAWEEIDGNLGKKIADYDHPVPLFAGDDEHELVRCLEELDHDMDFEKEKGVFPADKKLFVTLSVSVTHALLDSICSMWIRSLIEKNHYRNLCVLILTEHAVQKIREELFGGDMQIFSVFGKYARHFNALKYIQLLLEPAFGIRAGFKLDTDEGIHSRDLYAAKGKTWFQTLCHPLWGGRAADYKNRPVNLAVNEGEYVNSTDIDLQGYAESLRTPDVKPPAGYSGTNIFFHKGFAHGKATALYNRFDNLKDHISHPVVKGGGYGITNEGLRKAVPFTFSDVGRAEDQQFYFSGLSRGIAGIFHPDLRIVHYKESVAKSEKKTLGTRFIGDMYRLILFQHLAEVLGVKEEIDPMPGVFAGPLARSQALFHTLYNALAHLRNGNTETAEFLAGWGSTELRNLKQKIDSGSIRRRLEEEEKEWRLFIKKSRKLDENQTRRLLLQFIC